ncbi:MAG: APC family permease [Maricaulaceae bacterium]
MSSETDEAGVAASLKRAVGLASLTLYGVGVTIGAGIYVLIGETAAQAGSLAALSFLIAAVVAGFTALSYCELGARLPESAGEAAFVRAGLGSDRLAVGIGFAVMTTGVLSAATVLQGFAGYASSLVPAPGPVLILGALAVLLALTLWGVREAVWAAAAVTFVEAAGLIWVIAIGAPTAITAPVAFEPAGVAGVFAAASIAFFAFIGFEDIVNMAEETHAPERTLPRAILLTLAISTALYAGVVWVAAGVVPPGELAASADPIAEVFRRLDAPGVRVIALVASLAVANGALVQILMASRILYGLSRRGLVFGAFSRVHAKRRTPHVATLTIALVIAVLALVFPLAGLARATSFVTLIVFATVNLALLQLRRAGPPATGFRAPAWAPPLGLAASLGLAIVAAVVFANGG